jgi:hypothetical protein
LYVKGLIGKGGTIHEKLGNLSREIKTTERNLNENARKNPIIS